VLIISANPDVNPLQIAALSSLIYRKALRLSRTALGDTTVGQVVNLLSNDVGRFDLVLINVHYLWIAPLELIAVTYLMYLEVRRWSENQIEIF